jgi:hypothetical protein
MPRPDVATPSQARSSRSIAAALWGAIIAVLSALAVAGLSSSLTGGEGDLGPGLLMLMIGASALVAVAVLGIVAVHAGRKSSGSGKAKAGVILGTAELLAVIVCVILVVVWIGNVPDG